MKLFLHSILLVSAVTLAAAGCSTVSSFQKILEARAAMREGEGAVEKGEYSPAFKSYLKAGDILKSMRKYPLDRYASRKDVERLDRLMGQLEEVAEEKGLVRFDDGYLEGAQLGNAIAGVIKEMVKYCRIAAFPHERIVGEVTEAAVRKTPDGRRDVTIDLVLRETEEGGFSQDAWASVRFILEGGFGNGFAYHLIHPFPRRPWMSTEAFWGSSDKPWAENHIVELEDRIESLTINVYRGRYRKGSPSLYDRYGFESLEAVGPYWNREFFKRYRLHREAAKRCNWDEPGLIPDATLHDLLEIEEEED